MCSDLELSFLYAAIIYKVICFNDSLLMQFFSLHVLVLSVRCTLYFAIWCSKWSAGWCWTAACVSRIRSVVKIMDAIYGIANSGVIAFYSRLVPWLQTNALRMRQMSLPLGDSTNIGCL
eukprot:237188_1